MAEMILTAALVAPSFRTTLLRRLKSFMGGFIEVLGGSTRYWNLSITNESQIHRGYIKLYRKLVRTFGCAFIKAVCLSEGKVLFREVSRGGLRLANIVLDEKHVGALAQEHVLGAALQG